MRVIAVLMGLSACLDTEVELPPAIEILGVSPKSDVPDDEPVTIAFSGAIRARRSWPIVVRDQERELAFDVTAAETSLLLSPLPRWPAGASIEIAIGTGLSDELGRGVEGDSLWFTVQRRQQGEAPAIVRTPTPGTTAPANLGWISIALGIESIDVEAQLDSNGQWIELEAERALDGVVLFQLPEYRADCAPLCAGQRYQVSVVGWPQAAGPLGAIETGTTADLRPPEIIATKVVFRGGQPRVEICADEAILVHGEARSSAGEVIPFSSSLVAAERVLVLPAIPLDSATAHELVFEVEDVARNHAPSIHLPLVTPPSIAIEIGEIVAAPLRDWNDSEGGSVPFDPIPGIGTVSEADEWIELVNRSEAPIDLMSSGIELATIDTTPSVTPLAGAPGLYFGDGGTLDAWWPGEAIAVRPRGAMSSRSLIVEVSAGDQLFDRVVIGEESGADHAGGSPPNVTFESIARTESGTWSWCIPTPGDPLAARECD